MVIQENHEYVIEISLTPHTWDNKNEPYFWWVKEINEKGESYNTGCCGWAINPDKAWEQASKTWSEWLVIS